MKESSFSKVESRVEFFWVEEFILEWLKSKVKVYSVINGYPPSGYRLTHEVSSTVLALSRATEN